MFGSSSHISISDKQIMFRFLDIVDGASIGLTKESFATWPADVQGLMLSFATELFLVRYNPYISAELVRKSVDRRCGLMQPTLSIEYLDIIKAAIQKFWQCYQIEEDYELKVLEKLQKFLPEECIGTSANCRVECATDATDLRVELPLFVLFPKTVEQIQKIIKLAHEVDLSLIPRGGGTGATGGAVPIFARTAILSLSRFKKIIKIDEEKKLLHVQAGVITATAVSAAAEKGLLFTVDPASKAGSSLGGNISENAGGPLAFEYGSTIDNIYSYEMVTPKGDIIKIKRQNHPWHKMHAGETASFDIYDEKDTLLRTISFQGEDLRTIGLGKDVTDKFLMGLPGIQKEGIDGIITEAVFILHPKLRHTRVLCLEFYGRSMVNAMHTIKDIVAMRNDIEKRGDLVTISALEEFGAKYVQAIQYKAKSTIYSGNPISVLIVQLDSNEKEILLQAVDNVVKLTAAYEGVDAFVAKDAKDAELFWEDRHRLSAIAKRTSGFKINEDIVIPIDKIPEFAQFLEQLNLKYLGKIFAKALGRIGEAIDISTDTQIEDAQKKAVAIIRGEILASELSDEEFYLGVYKCFKNLQDTFPQHEKVIAENKQMLENQRIIIASHMHAGDGNCHVNIPVNSNDAEMLEQAHQAVEEVFETVFALNGVISGEHGIGLTKINFLAQSKIDAVLAYKEDIDEKNIFNPGKLTTRELPSRPYTFSFNSLIGDLEKTALKDKENLIHFLKSVQTCTRCGKCKQVCPMYHPRSRLMFHPRNKNISLGALIEAIYYSQIQNGQPEASLLESLREITEHCTGCGKCASVCPVNIDSAESTLHIRSFLEHKKKGGHPIKSFLMHTAAKNPTIRLPLFAKVMALGQAVQSHGVPLIPHAIRKKIDTPILRTPTPSMSFRNLIELLDLTENSFFQNASAEDTRAVLYFPGCGASIFNSSIGMATVYLLLKAGQNVLLPNKQLCCGYPLLSAGHDEAYKVNRHRNVQILSDLIADASKAGLTVDTFLTACGTCRESLESYDFKNLVSMDINSMDVFQFLITKIAKLPVKTVEEPILFHASCHAAWTGQNKVKAAQIYKASLEEILQTQVLTTAGCCAESGLGAMTSPKIYNKLREYKQEDLAEKIGKKQKKMPVLVGCPSCKMGITRCLTELGKKNSVLHTVEFLALNIGGTRWKKELKKMLQDGEKKGNVLLVKSI